MEICGSISKTFNKNRKELLEQNKTPNSRFTLKTTIQEIKIKQKQQTRRDTQSHVTQKPGSYIANKSTKQTHFHVLSPKIKPDS